MIATLDTHILLSFSALHNREVPFIDKGDPYYRSNVQKKRSSIHMELLYVAVSYVNAASDHSLRALFSEIFLFLSCC